MLRSVDIEVQKTDDDDYQRRVRYNASVLTANIANTGTQFRDIRQRCGAGRLGHSRANASVHRK